MKSLKKIATALTMSLLPVLNVFFILFMLMSICARREGFARKLCADREVSAEKGFA